VQKLLKSVKIWQSCSQKYTATFYEPRQKFTFWFFQVRCAHKSGDVINFITVACIIYSRLKWYKNYKNRLRLAKVIVKNKMSRFLWFTVYNRVMNNFIHHNSGSNEYKNKQTNITKLTLSIIVYQQKHDGQTCIRMCLQSELSTELYEAKNLVFNLLKWTLGNSNLLYFGNTLQSQYQ